MKQLIPAFFTCCMLAELDSYKRSFPAADDATAFADIRHFIGELTQESGMSIVALKGCPRQMNNKGYLTIALCDLERLDHPFAWYMGMDLAWGREYYHHYVSVLEHRLVASMMRLGPVGWSEVVHHVNGIKTDNRPCNLSVMSWEDHGKHHAQVLSDLNELRGENDRLRAQLEARQ